MIPKKRTCFLLLFLFSYLLAEAQYIYVAGATGDTYTKSMIERSDGSIISFGQVLRNGQNDALLIHMDTANLPMMATCFGSNANETGEKIIATRDGGYAVCGTTSKSGNMDVFVVKFDVNHQITWQKTWGGGANEEGYDITETADNGFAVVGYTRSYGGTFDMFVFKLDQNGVQQWSKVLSTLSSDFAYRITDDNGQLYINSTINVSSIYGNGDIFLMKLNADGTMAWSMAYGGSLNEHGWQSVKTADGNLLFICGSNSFSPVQRKDILLIKADTAGSVIWSKIIRVNDDGMDAYSLQENDDGTWIIAGSNANNTSYGHLIKVTTSGDPLWAKRFKQGSISELAQAKISADKQRYYFSGYYRDAVSGIIKSVVLKTDTSGNTGGCSSLEDLVVTTHTHNLLSRRTSNYPSITNNGTTANASWTLQTVPLSVTRVAPQLNISYDTICNGDSLLFAGKYLKFAGTYTDTVHTSGCPDIRELRLQVISTGITDTAFVLCAGDSLLFGSRYLYTAGNYADTTLLNRCPDIKRLNLRVVSGSGIASKVALCSGDSILFAGRYLKAAGTYADTLFSSRDARCFDAVQLQLSFISGLRDTSTIYLCSGDSVLFRGRYLHPPGYFADTIYAASRTCSDIFSRTLLIATGATKDSVLYLCAGDSLLLNGQYYHTTDTLLSDPDPLNSCDTVTRIRFLTSVNQVQLQDTFYFCSETATPYHFPGYATYAWSNGNASAWLTPDSSRWYYLTATDARGCRYTDSVMAIDSCVSAFLPSAFSPNNNGLNDYFELHYTGTMDLFNILIFDRWGEILYRSDDPGFRWDGKYKGVALPGGVYYYLLRYQPRGGLISNTRGYVLIAR